MRLAIIVEDDDDIRLSLRTLLEEEGFSVTTFASGTEALAYLQTQTTPHMVITDYLMPGISGTDFLQQALGQWHLHQHSYLMLAARPITRVDAQGQAVLKQWNIPYMKKPFDIEELLAAIATYHP